MARTPAPKHTRVCRVTKQKTLPDHDGNQRLLNFTIDGLARRTRFASVGEVPEFEGDVAFFEMEQRNKTKLGYVFLRQIDKPSSWKHWY
jgi:hypothetical protein